MNCLEDDDINYTPTINDKYKPPEYSSYYYKITEKIDMYSAGLVFLSLICQRPIYAKKNYSKYFEKIQNNLVLEVLQNLLAKD